MAIAHDASTRFPSTENTADTTTGDRTFTHTPTGTPKGVAVVLCCQGTSSSVTGVLYGGVAMALTSSATDTTEAGRVEVWTLTEADITTGAQTVTLQGCTASAKFATVSTVTAATTQTKVNASNAVNTTTSTNPQVTVTTTATTMTYGGLHTGNLAPLTTPAAGCTAQNNRDYGALAGNTSRRTAATSAGSVVLGWTFGTSDDWCMAAASLEEFDPTAQSVFTFTPGTWSNNFDSNLITGNDFSSAVTGEITGVYVWSMASGPASVTVAVHRQSDQTLMTSQVASMAQNDAWNLVTLTSPVTYNTPGEKFTISYINPSGFFVFKQSITNTTTGDLTAYVESPSPGRWLSSATAGQYPTNTDAGTGYGVGMLFSATGGSGVSGTLSASLSALQATSTGSVTAAGSVAATLPSLTASTAGSVSLSGSVGASLPPLSAALAGLVEASGSVAATLPSLTASFTGSVAGDIVAGSLNVTLPALSGSVAGSVGVSGDLAATLPALAAQVAGTVLVAGTSALTLPALSGQLAGEVFSPVVTRPFTGSVGRPLTGSVLRPFSGIVIRPFVGDITRP